MSELDIGGTIETVELTTLNVDPDYQRGLKHHWRKIAKKFDRKAAGLLVINMRPDGSLWIIDGQQRTAAMKLLNIKHWAARVFKLATRAEEAELFGRLNGSEQTIVKVGERDRFRALVVARQPAALALIEAARAGGLKVAVGCYRIDWPYLSCTAMLTQYQTAYGEANITAACRIIHDAWNGDPDALKHTIVEAVLSFVCLFPTADCERAAKKFASVPATRVAQEAKKGANLSQVSHRAGRDFLVTLYNKKLLLKNRLGLKKPPEEVLGEE